MVVLASHWSPMRTRLRCCAVKPRRSNRGFATSLASAVSRSRRAPRRAFQRVDQRAADALAGEFGIDKEHVDLVAALEAGEVGDRAVDYGDQGERALKASAESVLSSALEAHASRWSSS